MLPFLGLPATSGSRNRARKPARRAGLVVVALLAAEDAETRKHERRQRSAAFSYAHPVLRTRDASAGGYTPTELEWCSFGEATMRPFYLKRSLLSVMLVTQVGPVVTLRSRFNPPCWASLIHSPISPNAQLVFSGYVSGCLISTFHAHPSRAAASSRTPYMFTSSDSFQRCRF
jgi:hypothetical protein